MKYLITLLLLSGCGMTQIKKDVNQLKIIARDYVGMKESLGKYLDDEIVTFYKKDKEGKCHKLDVRWAKNVRKWIKIECKSMK